MHITLPSAPLRPAGVAPVEAPDHGAIVVATLELVLAALPKTDADSTRQGRQLRADVSRLLSDAQASAARGEPRRLPSLAIASEWRDQARFDCRINPGAVRELFRAKGDLLRSWASCNLPQACAPRQALLGWERDFSRLLYRSAAKPNYEALREFSQRLGNIGEQALDVLAERGERLHARLRASRHARAAPAVRFILAPAHRPARPRDA